MILVIDNYDSFTYNLVQYLYELGCDLTVKRNNEITAEEAETLSPTQILISPGPKTPDEAGCSVDLVKKLSGKIPILGVCLGHQSIGVAFGGKIVRAKKLMHGKTSEIVHDGSRLFEGIPSPFTSARYHSLVIDKNSITDDLVVSATTNDGTIMAVHHKSHLTFGVQFHPESIISDYGKRLLQNFLDQSAGRK